MVKIEVGQALKTNYGTGPYTVLQVVRGCVCTHPLDEIESIVRPLPAHMHLWLKDNEGRDAHLNYYDENTLCSVWRGDKDKIILLENPAPIQRSLSL